MNKLRPLRTALVANAISSTACALFMILDPVLVGELLGIQAPVIIRLIGAGLVLFAIDLVHQASRPRMTTWRARYASVADFLWVLGTLLGVLAFPGTLSGSGLLIVLAVAGVVAIFGLWQLWAILAAHRVPGSKLLRHCVLVNVASSADAVWDVVSQLGEIARYVPALASSEIIGGNHPQAGVIRRCVDLSGKSWSEECVEFDEPGRSFTLRFVSEAPDFPFPASRMLGGWQVMPAKNGGADVMVWWELEPKPKWLAPILLPLLGFRVDREFPDIIRRMAGDAGASAGTHPLARLVPRTC